MKRLWLVGLAGMSVMLAAALLFLSGCGGGGGPINQPVNNPNQLPTQAVKDLIAANSPAQVNATAVGSDKCLSCHTDNYHAGWKKTKHFQNNVSCENCHGPGSVHATDRAANLVKADILALPAVQEPVICGQCHGPIFDQLESSPHAEPVAEVIEEAEASGSTGRNCGRCHVVAMRNKYINAPWTQGLLAGKSISQIQTDADTAILAIPDDQVAALARASHQTANCVTCHDPHTPTGVKDSEGEELQLRRHPGNTDRTSALPGSPAPVHTNWDQTCATCHNGRGGNPDKALTATARPNFHEGPQYNMLSGITGVLPQGAVVQNGKHFEAPDQCVHCHMPNASHTFTVNLDISCQPCHTAADAAAREGSVRNEILTGLLVLRTRMETWAQAKFGNPAYWDYYTLASDDPNVQNAIKAIQSQIPPEIYRARHNYYFIKRDGSLGVHNTPYARQLLAYAQSQLDALGVSRDVKITRSVKVFQQSLKADRARAILSERMIRSGEIQ